MIRAVERAFAIFEAFDHKHTMLTLQEIGKRIGLSKATTYRLVNCLYDLGYLVRLEDNRYCLSLKLTRLSGLVRSTIGIRDVAQPIMRRPGKENRRDHNTQYHHWRSTHLHRGLRNAGAADEYRHVPANSGRYFPARLRRSCLPI